MKNKVVVITGSARGIGFSIAKEFAKMGATPIIWDVFEDGVKSAVEELSKNGYSAFGNAVDVTNPEIVEKTFKQINQKYGKIDCLINNAGITKDGLILKMKLQDWKAVIDINLTGTFICTQKVSRIMLKQRFGNIINIASVIGLMGNLGQANYAASKGGIISLTKTCAKEFASRNIRVNAIAPGFIKTAMTQTLPSNVVKNYTNAIPLKKLGDSVDVANLCIFLTSEKARYITGQTIQVDGGLLM